MRGSMAISLFFLVSFIEVYILRNCRGRVKHMQGEIVAWHIVLAWFISINFIYRIIVWEIPSYVLSIELVFTPVKIYYLLCTFGWLICSKRINCATVAINLSYAVICVSIH